MRKTTSADNQKSSNELHPLVYAGAVGLVLWFAMSAWIFFDDGEYDELTLAVVSGLFLMLIAIPCTLWLTWRRHQDPETKQGARISLRDWASREFNTLQGPQSAAQATVEILLPLAAVAFGLTAIGIVLYFVSGGVGHS